MHPILKRYHPMKKTLVSMAAGVALSVLALPSQAGLLDQAALSWTHAHNSTNGYLSEILSFDGLRNEVWVSGVSGIDILDARTGSFLQRIDTRAFGSVNSVSIHNGVAALAIENSSNRELPGVVQLYNTASRTLTASYTVGPLPDMLTFTKDGSKILVANEATPNSNHYGARTSPAGTFPRTYGSHALDPAGSVSIINVATGAVTTSTNLSTALRTGTALRTNTGMDFEPEYIAVNAAGTKAYVTLQEANGIGVLDIATGQFDKVVGLGTKDFSLPGNQIDPKNDGKIELTSVKAKGLYMPDGVATYERNGRTYLVMANEGDFREDDADRSAASTVDPSLDGTLLSNLRVSNTDSFAGNLYAAGARSFSIRDEDGNLVYDSGNILDREAIALGLYDDSRSRDKGVEPEGIEIMEINGRVIAFVGLERTLKAAVAAFDITDPNQVSFLRMLVAEGSVSPEGLKGFRIGNDYYLGLSNEVTNTTAVFYLTSAVPEAESYALALAGSPTAHREAETAKAHRG